MATMTELKRKREDVDDGKSEDEVAGTNDIAPTQSTSSSPSCQSTPPPPQQCSSEEEGEIRSHGDGSATSTRVVSVAADKADKPTAKSAAADRQTILICGKEVVLKSTGGRKRRKHPIETLVILAYKSRLAITCQANDMVGALEIHREMKNKGVKQDLSTHLMVIAVCGGSPGGKDELDPGNGSTTPCAAAAAGNKAAASEVEQDADSSASRGAEPRSAQANAFAAAEAALQIFSEASKDGTVTLPESAYTSVIRACCLDGRPDRAREILGSLKRAGGKPRVRTYAPLLEAYAGLDGRLEDCLAVWRDAVSAPDGLTMTEREYLHLIAACTRARDEERFLEVMDEYMDDVLQPRSRHSWDVLKAWFLAAGGRENTTTTTTTTTATTAAATMSATAAATGTVAATTAVAADSTTEKCEEEDDEEMTPVLPRDVDGDGGDGCGHGDSAEEKRTPRETRGAETTVAVEPPNAPDKDGDGGVALASESAEEQMQVTPETETAAAAAEAPNALEKDRAVDAAPPAAPSPLYVEGPSTPPPTSNAEERVRETLETESTAAAEPPNAPEKDGAVVAAPPLAPSPVDADGAATPPPPMTAATASVSAADGDGNSDVASSTRPPRTADDSSEAACGAQPSGGDGGDGGDGAGAGNGGGGGACGDWIVSECRVGDDGSCGSCGEVLRSIDLSKDDEERLLKQIEVLVCTNEQRTKQWEGFCASIERRGKERYDVIIDGANVGYFKKNAAGAGELADLRQVDWAVKKYEEEGKKPLVVLHSRHIVEKRLSAEAKAIVARWKEAGILQTCAPKNNDDWYWLHAAVYTGGKVLVLTNDEMRDHHFSMLSHRSFQRWKERHQARFHFGSWKDDVREVVTDEPPLYSKRTQKSERSFHIPLLGSRDWLCATRQPRKTAKSSSSSSGSSQAAAIAEGR